MVASGRRGEAGGWGLGGRAAGGHTVFENEQATFGEKTALSRSPEFLSKS